MKRGIGIVICCLWARSAAAVPGPDSVAVVANRNVPGSLALAERYRAARQIPRVQVCALDLPTTDTIPLARFRSDFQAALEACLGEQLGRIEALTLVRGLPLRVSIPIPNGQARVSLAAAAALFHTTTATGAPFLGQPPGTQVNCGGGNTCYGARISNPFLRQGTFEAGWHRSLQGIEHQPLLVTMLHGRSDEEAALLISSATTAEALGGATGEFLFMNGADTARGSLDRTFDGAIADLTALGYTAHRVPFDRNLVGHDLAAFFVGTAGLGDAIEGNRFAPGALVDNLTSFGALPPNFEDPSAEVQVSIARWVAQGVAGVHGTTDEPLSNAFPSRQLVVDYAEGGTLAEAYFRYLPFVYWQNLVLGDPMAAPYARRPLVVVEGLAAGDRPSGAQLLHVTAADPLGRPIARLQLFLDGVLLAEATEGVVDICSVTEPGPHQLLAVAQVDDDGSPGARHRPKGWLGFDYEALPGRADCTPEPDAGAPPDGAVALDGTSVAASSPDAAGVDATFADGGGVDQGGAGPEEDASCGCTEARGTASPAAWLPWLLAGLAWRGRRRERVSEGRRP